LAGARHVGEHLAFELLGVGGFGLWHGVGFLFGFAALPVHQTGVTSVANASRYFAWLCLVAVVLRAVPHMAIAAEEGCKNTPSVPGPGRGVYFENGRGTTMAANPHHPWKIHTKPIRSSPSPLIPAWRRAPRPAKP